MTAQESVIKKYPQAIARFDKQIRRWQVGIPNHEGMKFFPLSAGYMDEDGAWRGAERTTEGNR